MKSTPEIAVILPVYNCEQYIVDSIQSLLNQTFSNFELLVIDDGSTDRTAEIVSQIHDPRLRLIRNETNIGLVMTLNKALDLCKATFIARMDADDIALPDRFEKQLAFLKNNTDIGICGTHFTFFGNTSHTTSILPCTDDALRITLLFRSALAHPTVLMRKSILDQFRLSYNADFPSAEDYKLWTDFALHTKMANLKDRLLQYRVHENQITQTKVEEKENSLKRIHTAYLNALGLAPDDQESEVHYRLSGGRGARNTNELDATLIWLLKLQTHLKQISFAEEQAVYTALSNEWRKTCENSGLGRSAWKAWHNSGLKSNFSSLKDRFRFWMKIITHYTAH